ncbi:S-layer homology domain-containing protein [Capillibacterium thermochitinicola]|uniref:S-layer homology domain-containing protein n=1 Tax=Capillibacterium thermochitinicola TaxID=2699427 RepID=A0A8J6I249_9FIRM|nr:S-layer homology domain-containing protein [Capillibacterium thermochitinicola]MBA2133858.1 S-layer homology domain-containing protein [Capillibacterium thermochitinicola]
MFSLRHRLILSLLLLLTFLLVTPVVQAVPADVAGHWVEDSVKNLIAQGILHGYPDGTFRPDQSITRAELAKTLAVAYGLNAAGDQGQFPDAKGHWAENYIAALAEAKIITGYPDGSFKPEAPVTRAEMVVMLTRLLKLGTEEEHYTVEFIPTFSDVAADYWAFYQIEMAAKLGLLPRYYGPDFNPSRLASRADTAWMLQQLLNLKTVRGQVIGQPEAGTNLITVRPEGDGEIEIAVIPPEAVVFRNNITTTVDTLTKDDQITIYYNRNDEPTVVKAFGEVNKSDLLSRISALVKGRLTTEQIAAILAGNWDKVKEGIKGELYDQLLKIGLTAEEAEAILVQDWSYLDSVSRDRLASALSGYLGITKDLSGAILARDWERIKEFARIELTAMALEKILD